MMIQSEVRYTLSQFFEALRQKIDKDIADSNSALALLVGPGWVNHSFADVSMPDPVDIDEDSISAISPEMQDEIRGLCREFNEGLASGDACKLYRVIRSISSADDYWSEDFDNLDYEMYRNAEYFFEAVGDAKFALDQRKKRMAALIRTIYAMESASRIVSNLQHYVSSVMNVVDEVANEYALQLEVALLPVDMLKRYRHEISKVRSLPIVGIEEKDHEAAYLADQLYRVWSWPGHVESGFLNNDDIILSFRRFLSYWIQGSDGFIAFCAEAGADLPIEEYPEGPDQFQLEFYHEGTGKIVNLYVEADLLREDYETAIGPGLDDLVRLFRECSAEILKRPRGTRDAQIYHDARAILQSEMDDGSSPARLVAARFLVEIVGRGVKADRFDYMHVCGKSLYGHVFGNQLVERFAKEVEAIVRRMANQIGYGYESGYES